MNNTLEIISVVSSLIGVVFPIVKFIIESIDNKKRNRQQYNVANVQGSNNNIVQQNNITNETRITNINYHYHYKVNTSSKKELSLWTLVIIGIVSMLILSVVFIKFSFIITVTYLISFAALMIFSGFSPFSIKKRMILYVLNVIIMISIIIFTNKNMMNLDVAFLYSELLEKSNLKAITDYVFSGKIYITFQVVLIMILQLFACASTVLQCLLHLFHIIYCRIKGVNAQNNNRIYSFLRNVSVFPLIIVLSIILALLLRYFQQEFVQ